MSNIYMNPNKINDEQEQTQLVNTDHHQGNT